MDTRQEGNSGKDGQNIKLIILHNAGKTNMQAVVFILSETPTLSNKAPQLQESYKKKIYIRQILPSTA